MQVRYPDQRVQVVTPQATAWKRLGQLRHRLVMQVLLAHGLWSGNARNTGLQSHDNLVWALICAFDHLDLKLFFNFPLS